MITIRYNERDGYTAILYTGIHGYNGVHSDILQDTLEYIRIHTNSIEYLWIHSNLLEYTALPTKHSHNLGGVCSTNEQHRRQIECTKTFRLYEK